MINKLFPFFAYLKYWFLKEDKYSLQSPFLYNLYFELFNFIINRKESDFDIEKVRHQLLENENLLKVEDYGAGSKKVNNKIRRISQITRYSTSSRKFAQLYQYFCSLTPAETVFELGTCMGLTSRYLSRITSGSVFTFEGSEEILKIAKESGEIGNIKFISGRIQEQLRETLETVEKVDFALIDANHTYIGTLDSFYLLIDKMLPSSILLIADIHWSIEMDTAWEEIIKDKRVKLSLDFYECGVIFFDAPNPKNHYVLDF